MEKTSASFEVIKEAIIKPSSPTPPSLKHYKLSLIDQLMTSIYTPVVLFFPQESSNDSYNEQESTLEKSLSELLTFYYPFAGRRVDNNSVECNDMGAIFREVRLNFSVSELLEKPHACVEDTVFPIGLPWDNNVPNGEGNLAVAQLTHFSCGGKALSVCLSHKVGDGATLFNFFSDWASMARKTIQKPCPLFNSPIIYPPIESQDVPEDYDLKNRQRHIPTRIIFESSKINLLKATIATESGVPNPTRVEVVTAFCTNAVLEASMFDSSSFNPIMLFLPVNIRSRTNAPVQQHSVGNFLSYLHIPISNKEDMKLANLVSKIRSEKVKNYDKYKGLNENELLEAADEERKMFQEIDDKKVGFFSVTSMCGFPYQDLDFGWGKPLRVTFPSIPKKNYFVLLNDPSGKSVEAITTLEEKVLKILQRDQEFLSIATLE